MYRQSMHSIVGDGERRLAVPVADEQTLAVHLHVFYQTKFVLSFPRRVSTLYGI